MISSRRRLSVVLAAAAVVLPILAGIAATESEASAQLAAVANCTTPGVVCAWGDNSWGVLGNGSGSDTLVPGPVSTLTDVVKVSATAATSFRAFTFALQADGTVWSWGYGADGQLGTGGFLRGNLPSSSVPQKIPTLANIVDVAAGPFEGFGYAVGRDGSVSSWGAGWDGQLGNNTYGENAWSSAPTPVLGLDDVVAVDASNHNGFALSRNGTVWAWGSGYGGMLGNGTLGDPDTHRALTPVQVSLPPGITAIAAGSQNAYALDSNGAVWAWGTCLNGALGDPTYFCGTDPLTPVRVATPAGVRIVQIAAANTNVGTAYALGEDGIVRAWGFGYQGELGDGSSGIESDGQYHFNATPGPVSNLTDVMSIGAAGGNGYAVLRDGTAWSWGTRRDGVLGDGSTGGNGPGALVPVQIVGLSYPKAITGALTGYAVIGHPQAYGPPCPAGTPRAGEPRRKGDTNCDGKVRIAILGDSYISGEGSADAVDQEPPNEPTWGYGATDTDANNCHRSEASWAYRVASTLAGEPADGIAFIACSGAAMANFFNHAQYPESPSNVVGGGIQLDDLESFDLDGGLDRGSTDLVFLSVGGNDVGFGDIIRECMLGSCVPGANSRYLPRPDGIRAELDHTYAAIAALAPSAEIWVADYMNAITGRECRATGASDLINFLPASLTGSEDHRLTVSRPEQLYFKNTFLPALNGAIHDEVTALGLRQFPTYSQFAGHELCEDQPYVNGFKGGDETFTYKGVTLPQIVGKESWHPNPMGHRRMANSFLSTIVSRTDFGTLPSYHGVIASPAVVPPIPVVSGSGGVNPDSPGKLIQPAAPLTIQGSGAPPATTLRIVIQSMPTVLANPVSDANGDFSVTLPMPAWLPPGFHVLTVDDPATGAVIGTDLIAADAAAGCAPDPNESDVDEDLRPDLCDPDLSDGPAADGDGDGVVNGLDDCVAVADPGQADANDNGVGDACDPELGKDLFTGARPAGLAAGTFVSLAPTRVLDTRHAVGVSTTTAVPAFGSVTLKLAGAGGVPAMGAAAVMMNVTVTQTKHDGYVTVYPSGTGRPLASSLNFVANQTIPNLVTVKLGDDGKVVLYNGSADTLHLVADVSGYFVAGTPTEAGTFVALSPTRILDTRNAIGVDTTTAVPANGSVALTVAGVGGVPGSGVSAVLMNVTVTQPHHDGYVTAYPSGTGRPLASNLNFAANQTIPNLVTVKVGEDGKVLLYNGSPDTVQLVADVSGYFRAGTPTLPGTFVALSPARILDTRDGTGVPAAGLIPNFASVALAVTGHGGVPPSGVSAVMMNVTVAQTGHDGFVTVYPNGIARPLASNLNFGAGQAIPNLVAVRAGTDGKVVLYNGSAGTLRLVGDVAGYFLG